MSDPIDDSDLGAPPGLQRDLRALFARRQAIPDSIGTSLRQAASRPRRPFLLQPVNLCAAAAALLLATAAMFLLQRGGSSVAVAREDYDGNGRVDVLDAYRLVLAIDRGDPVATSFDLDGSGRVDRRDAELLAAHAVSIRG